MKVPMDIECPACRALPGDLCRQILVDGTSHPTESVDFHHASCVDAAFRSLADAAAPGARGVATSASPPTRFLECPGCAAHRRNSCAQVPCTACQQNRATIRQLTALLIEAYEAIGKKPTLGRADWLRRAKGVLGR